MEEVEQFDNISLEDLVEGTSPCDSRWQLSQTSGASLELPENSPRYIVLSYELKHRDGRTSFPLVIINWIPPSTETSLLTLHASAFVQFQQMASISKVH